MKLLNVIDEIQNMMIEEPQHCRECQLIQDMKMKIHPIAFNRELN
jgi:hypothetical protein